MDSSGPVMYLVLVVLIIMSGFFSSSETAYASLNKIRIKSYADNGNKKAKTAIEIANDFERMISAILIGNNVVNIAASSIATVIATNILGENYGPVVSTVVMTILVLIFGEVLPKCYGKQNSESIALNSGGILKLLIKLFSPFIFILVKLQSYVIKLTSKNKEAEPSITEEELMYIIENVEEEGVLNEDESELVQSALEFNDITVKEVLTHRVDIVAVDINDGIDEIVDTVIKERFSRIPVYDKTIDKIVGILRTRDLLEAKVLGKEIILKDLMSKPIYVHKTKKISELLNEFKRDKNHIAIVTDDYGGTMGIVTMEDMLEELVGEIWDEDEIAVKDIIQTSENSYIVIGDTSISDFEEEFDINEKDIDTDYDYVSGWVLEMLGHIPEVGEVFTFNDLKITVIEMNDNRVVKLKVDRIPHENS